MIKPKYTTNRLLNLLFIIDIKITSQRGGIL